MVIQEVQKHLVDHNIKPSMQRVAIMQYLMENKTHPTIDEIFTSLSPSMPTLSKTTVYNTLKLFSDQKAALCLTIDDKNLRFDGDTSVHAHFKCKKCGMVYDIELVENNIPSLKGYPGLYSQETQVYFFGVCKECF